MEERSRAKAWSRWPETSIALHHDLPDEFTRTHCSGYIGRHVKASWMLMS